MSAPSRLAAELPPSALVRDQLGDALREVALLRRLLRLAEKAEEIREVRQSDEAKPNEGKVG